MIDAVFATGAVVITVGAWLAAPWAGVIVGGCWLCAFGAIAAMAEKGKRK